MKNNSIEKIISEQCDVIVVEEVNLDFNRFDLTFLALFDGLIVINRVVVDDRKSN